VYSLLIHSQRFFSCVSGTAQKPDATSFFFLFLSIIMVNFKEIVYFEISFRYILSYLEGIQDVGVFVSTVFSIWIFLGQIVLVCQLYNGGLWSPPQRACTEKFKYHMTHKCKYTLMAYDTKRQVCVRKRTVFFIVFTSCNQSHVQVHSKYWTFINEEFRCKSL